MCEDPYALLCNLAPQSEYGYIELCSVVQAHVVHYVVPCTTVLIPHYLPAWVRPAAETMDSPGKTASRFCFLHSPKYMTGITRW